ncbi:hypothetical protein MSSIT_0907 [Methanosarcina siciliae T4/M]|uniref:Uncharacterized protein n=2 Tax=Methanosarcina siciliae TaxID=38027 RepID=A0A0E3PBK2_9EURY|nr:hypothetical protein MSSIT_0907 [Methanosarcina siciliae T4/M]AKB31563.1 hypothetical protein MSSIH_0873 [Methanosarcina siciliae HI350]
MEISDVSRNTALNIRKRYLEEDLPNALFDKPISGQLIKYTEKHAAEVIALACSSSQHSIRILLVKHPCDTALIN